MNLLEKEQRRPVPAAVFLIIEAILYTLYLTLDLRFQHTLTLSDIFKYAGIVVCFFYTCYISRKHPSAKGKAIYLVWCAFLVLFSDYCLLFTHHYLPGILIFAAVQCLYFMYQAGPRRLPRFFIEALAIAFPAAIVLTLIWGLHSFLIYPAAFYMALLVINVAHAFRQWHHNPCRQHLYFAVGLLLYGLCDLNVGFMNAPGFFSDVTPAALHVLAAPAVQEMTTYAMWLFYLPAQVLIALSLNPDNN